jgi:hypothetical protein
MATRLGLTAAGDVQVLAHWDHLASPARHRIASTSPEPLVSIIDGESAAPMSMTAKKIAHPVRGHAVGAGLPERPSGRQS